MPQCRADGADGAEFRAEIVAPFTDAVRFIHGEERDPGTGGEQFPAKPREALG